MFYSGVFCYSVIYCEPTLICVFSKFCMVLKILVIACISSSVQVFDNLTPLIFVIWFETCLVSKFSCHKPVNNFKKCLHIIKVGLQLLWFHQYSLNTNFHRFHCWVDPQKLMFLVTNCINRILVHKFTNPWNCDFHYIHKNWCSQILIIPVIT